MLLFIFGFNVTKFLIINEKKIPNYGDFFLIYYINLLQNNTEINTPYLQSHYANQNNDLYLPKN